MIFLLACAPPTPTLAVPPVPQVEWAEALPVDRLLTPTPFGASTDILCPWARGETVPDASITRWLAEERLAWRVADVAGRTLAGRPFPELRTLQDAQQALEARCGATLPREALVVAGVASTHGEVATVIQVLGEAYEPVIAVSGPLATAPAAPTSGPAIVLGLGRTPQVFRDNLRVEGSPDLGGARCVAVAASRSGVWGRTVAYVAQGRRGGADVFVGQMVVGDAGEPDGAGEPEGTDGPVANVPLHGSVPVLRLRTPIAGGIGCGEAVSEETAGG